MTGFYSGLPEKRMINWSMFAIHGSNRKVRGLRPEKMISQQTLSEPQWWKYSDFVTLELDTYSELTWLRSRRSRTEFLRDLLHPLVCIFVVQNNEFSPTSKVYKNFFRPKEHQRVLTVTNFPPQSLDLKLRRSSIALHKKNIVKLFWDADVLNSYKVFFFKAQLFNQKFKGDLLCFSLFSI